MKKQIKGFNKLTRESIESLSKEFDLSEKIKYCRENATRNCVTGLSRNKTKHIGYRRVIHLNDIKEFIRQTIDDIEGGFEGKELINRIKNRAGEKLK